MRDPARKEEHWIGTSQVSRIKALEHIAVNEVARVIQQHDDHDDSTQQID